MTATDGQLANQVTSAFCPVGMEPRLGVYGCGGAGNNIVSALRDYGIEGIARVAINTDAEHLARTDADTRILLGERMIDGKGTGGSPEIGEWVAEAARDVLRQAINCDIVFLVAGLGGGTGTGVTPVLAEVAHEAGAVSICIAVMPFSTEGRCNIAEKGLERLRDAAEAVVVIKNDLLLELVGDLPAGESLSVVSAAVAQIVKSTAERLSSAYVTAMYDDVGEVAREAIAMPEGGRHPTELVTPTVVEASAEVAPVAFDDGGFIGRG